MLKVHINKKNGTTWDISELVSEATWTTSRIGRPSSLNLTFIKGGIYQSQSFSYENGDLVEVLYGKTPLFLGYIFSIDSGMSEAVKITAYDQTRYLLSNETSLFKNVTATEVIRRIADNLKLNTGALVDTEYRIPSLLEENKKLLDTICKALDLTLIATRRNYVFFDDFGKLTLRNIEQMMLPIFVGDNSLMYDYEYKKTIDSDTYTRIKLVKENKQTGRREAYVDQSDEHVKRWGVLQLYETVDEQMNEAQIHERLNQLLTLKSRESKSIQVRAIGDIRVRAGCMLPLMIGEFGIQQYFLIDECKHTISGADHTMSLQLKVI